MDRRPAKSSGLPVDLIRIILSILFKISIKSFFAIVFFLLMCWEQEISYGFVFFFDQVKRAAL